VTETPLAIVYGDVVPPWPGETLTLPGRTLHVRHAEPTTPGAPPAVYVHGLGGSTMNWTDLMGALQDDVDGVAIDLPGFGLSPPPRDGDYSPAGHARAVADLIEARFGNTSVHLFGNSMGGAVLVQLAARRPELVRSLTLISPALPERVPRLTNVHLPVLAVPGVGASVMKRYLNVDPATRARATIDLCFHDPSRIPDVRWEEFAGEVVRRDTQPHVAEAFVGSLRGLMASYLDLGSERPWRLAERITAPVLMIYGRQDKLVNPKSAIAAGKAFADVRVVVLHDCGHVAQMEHPDEVAGLWRDFARPLPAA
jgi:pimeloyl-ACP methyl ester carboxylesterase